MCNAWKMKEQMEELARGFVKRLQDTFGYNWNTCGCIHYQYDPPHVTIQLEKDIWTGFVLDQEQPVIVLGESHPRQDEMLAVIEEFFYKGENNGNE